MSSVRALLFFLAGLVLSPQIGLAQFYSSDSADVPSALRSSRSFKLSSVKMTIEGVPCSGTAVNEAGDLTLTAFHCVTDCLEKNKVGTVSNLNLPTQSQPKGKLIDIPPSVFPVQCSGQVRMRGGLQFTDTSTEFEILAAGPGYIPPSKFMEVYLLMLANQDPDRFQQAAAQGFLGVTPTLDYALVRVSALAQVPREQKSCASVAFLEHTPPHTPIANIGWSLPTERQDKTSAYNSDGYHQYVTLGATIEPSESKSSLIGEYLRYKAGGEGAAIQTRANSNSVSVEAMGRYLEAAMMNSHALLTTADVQRGFSGGGSFIYNGTEPSLVGIVHGYSDRLRDPTFFQSETVATSLYEVRQDLKERFGWSDQKLNQVFNCSRNTIAARAEE